MKMYFRVLSTAALLLLLVAGLPVFFGLFFYESFSIKQIGIQGGLQFTLFTTDYVIILALKRLWSTDHKLKTKSE